MHNETRNEPRRHFSLRCSKLMIAVVIAAIAAGTVAANVAFAYPPSVTIGAATAPTTPPRNPQVDSRLDVIAGVTVSISASGIASYGSEGDQLCMGNPSTDPDGNRWVGVAQCSRKYDPGAVLPSSPIGALIGEIVPPLAGFGCPDSPPPTGWFFVGSSYSAAPSISGRLYLAYNDSPTQYGNNTGSYTVTLPSPLPERARLAQRILQQSNIQLATSHDSKHVDNATAAQNMSDTAAGGQASLSCYENAPGGAVLLQPNMLSALLSLSRAPYSFTFLVSEIAGGSHGIKSKHYSGRAFDVPVINGQDVITDPNAPAVTSFNADCKALGASLAQIEVQNNHVHCEWPLAP